MIDYSLYLITDSTLCQPQSISTVVATLLPCGVSCVQLRMKNTDPKTILSTGRALMALLTPHKIKLIINDHLEIAEQLNAAGVHLGQHDTNVNEARQRLGKDKIIGLSIENIAQAKHYANAEVDYFGVGPIFPTTTKPNAAPSIGITTLQQIRNILDKPIVAIGGITHNNAAAILKTGVDGLAIISAILANPDRRAACMTMQQIIQQEKDAR